tara:strand:+ start:8154 stop:8405 length:252 start_codon:yes stop_codon:yes gene_type:complete
MQNIKLSKKEVERLENLQNSLAVTIDRLGQVGAAEIELEERKKELKSEFKKLRSSQQKLATELQEKYGEGTINLETGEFISPE